MTPNRRWLYYIKPAFQRRLIAQFCLLALTACAAFGGAVYWYATRTLTTAFVHSKLRIVSTADFLLPALVVTVVLIGGTAAVVAAVRLLIFSHQIAGPLYRVEQAARAIGRGQLASDIHLREGDALQDVADSMNGMAADLRRQMHEIRSRAQYLRELVLQARRAAAAPPELLQQLEQAQAQLDEAIGHFQA